ncbi:MAG: competence/damage-inducible protein A [Bacteroidia bacterium]
MQAEIITIGDEILIGQIVDTNSAWLGQQLSTIGVQVAQISSVSDQAPAIIQALELAQGRAQLILITGGLGPTKDDITKHTLVDYFGSKLVTRVEVLKKLRAWFEQRGRQMNELNARQADLPDNCELLDNELGTAQGMLWRHKGCVVVSMPGVPYEMKHIVSERLLPWLRREYELPVLVHRTIMTCGLVESRIAELIHTIEDSLPAHIKLAYLPRPGIVRLRLSAHGPHRASLEQEVAEYEHRITQLLGYHVYGFDDELLEAAIGRRLATRSERLATAESCTGGRIAAQITAIAGASVYFEGSVVSYSNAAKQALLGVKSETLEAQGAVSEAVVQEMAAGLFQQFRCNYAIAVSGIAGPTGGTDSKPVGTVCMAIFGPKQQIVRTYNFGHERSLNIERASMMALYQLWKMLATN